MSISCSVDLYPLPPPQHAHVRGHGQVPARAMIITLSLPPKELTLCPQTVPHSMHRMPLLLHVLPSRSLVALCTLYFTFPSCRPFNLQLILWYPISALSPSRFCFAHILMIHCTIPSSVCVMLLMYEKHVTLLHHRQDKVSPSATLSKQEELLTCGILSCEISRFT